MIDLCQPLNLILCMAWTFSSSRYLTACILWLWTFLFNFELFCSIWQFPSKPVVVKINFRNVLRTATIPWTVLTFQETWECKTMNFYALLMNLQWGIRLVHPSMILPIYQNSSGWGIYQNNGGGGAIYQNNNGGRAIYQNNSGLGAIYQNNNGRGAIYQNNSGDGPFIRTTVGEGPSIRTTVGE